MYFSPTQIELPLATEGFSELVLLLHHIGETGTLPILLLAGLTVPALRASIHARQFQLPH
jgi:hypothetical protein